MAENMEKENIFTLTDEETGAETEFELIGELTIDDNTYLALIPLEGDEDEYVVLKVEVDENGDTITKKFPVLKTYTVFNVKQCKDIEQKHYTDEEINEFEKDLTADGIVVDYLERTGVKLEHVKQNEAFYKPSTDSITMPLQEQFKTAGDYYSTLFHEITHSTGHKTRLDRISEMASFGSADYSTEELVAEIGSASILSTIGLQDSKTLEQSASYCKSWLKALKNDKKMIVIASTRAEKAIQLILGI